MMFFTKWFFSLLKYLFEWITNYLNGNIIQFGNRGRVFQRIIMHIRAYLFAWSLSKFFHKEQSHRPANLSIHRSKHFLFLLEQHTFVEISRIFFWSIKPGGLNVSPPLGTIMRTYDDLFVHGKCSLVVLTTYLAKLLM